MTLEQSPGDEVRLEAKVEDVDENGVLFAGEALAGADCAVGCGVQASPAAKWLGAQPDKAGRVAVGPDLSVDASGVIFVVGDVAASLAWNGELVPGLRRRQTGRRLCRARYPQAYRGPASPETVPLPSRGQSRDHRAAGGRRGLPRPQGSRSGRLVAMGSGAYPVPGRRAKPVGRASRLGLGLSDLQARIASYHRPVHEVTPCAFDRLRLTPHPRK